MSAAGRPPRQPGSALLFAAAALAALAAQAAPAAASPLRVRVVLHEGSGAVLVRGGSAGPTPLRVWSDGSQVRLGSRPAGRSFGFSAAPEPAGLLEVAGRRVRGRVEARADRRGLTLVNVLPLEDYVAGVVGRELPHSFSDEALKAQAVAARTFALHRIGRSLGDPHFALRASTDHQVYGGADAESARVRQAVAGTRGEYLSYAGQAILAAYHASSGGRTAGSDEVWSQWLPYLVSQPVQGEDLAPEPYWRASISRTTLGRALAPLGVRVGSVVSLRVEDRSRSGRAARLRVRGSRGERWVDAGKLRRALGETRIRSTRFEIQPTEDGFVFAGTGYGHGVGMSQWGAEAMARRGADYREILAHFYPGTRLEPELPGVAGGPP